MRILVVSDTHGDSGRVYDVYKKLVSEAPIDIIVHCGDYIDDALEIQARLGKKVCCVKGNCDGEFGEDEYAVLETEAGDFLVVHGHMQDVGYSQERVYYLALEHDCIGVLFGHTHRALFVKQSGIVFLNPGSLSRPRDGSGGTCALLETDKKGISGRIIQYDELVR